MLQAVIKDTQGSGIDLWLQGGFSKVIASVTTQIGSTFNHLIFRPLFETLCTLEESFFEQFVSKIEEFFMVFAELFLKHDNKYIRKFSLHTLSYLVSNLSEEQYSEFMVFLLGLHSEGFFDKRVQLAALLVQRLKVVKGCLTTASLTLVFNQLKELVDLPVDAANSDLYE